MHPPNPIFIYKAGVKNAIDIAVLWHLALCGLTGAGYADIAAALGANENTARTSVDRLLDLKLVAKPERLDRTGRPCVWLLSRLGYRLMTGHLKTAEKEGIRGQLPMPSEIIHQS